MISANDALFQQATPVTNPQEIAAIESRFCCGAYDAYHITRRFIPPIVFGVLNTPQGLYIVNLSELLS